MRAGPAAGASLSRRYRLAEGVRASGSVAQEDSTGGQARLGGGRVAGRIVATVDLGDDMCIRRRRSRGCCRKERGSTGDGGGSRGNRTMVNVSKALYESECVVVRRHGSSRWMWMWICVWLVEVGDF